jgi:prevent-host-death family protein
MRRDVSAVSLRQHFGDYLGHVQHRGDAVVVTKHGKPVAALVAYPVYERLCALRSLFESLSARLGRTYEGVPEAAANTEIEEAVRAVRRHNRT